MICARCYDVSETLGAHCGMCGENPLLEGRYRLERQVGQGASARTYRAVCVADGRVADGWGTAEQVVAIKELLFHRIDALKTLELFEREARVLRQLSHQGIPKYVETFQVEDGRNLCFYLVQEFIEGRTLLAEMDTRRFDERAVLEFLVELAGPVGYLHGLPVSVVHRDIKPANIMRRAVDGQVMLIDFGTVRDVFNPQGQGNTVAGTFGYMAPEQMMGEATPACDIYAIGATAVALLTGQDVLSAEQRLEWLGKMNLSASARQLLMTILDERPERRPTIGVVRDRAQAILRGDSVQGQGNFRAQVSPVNVSAVGHEWSGRVDLADREEDERLVEAASAAFRGRGEMQAPQRVQLMEVREETEEEVRRRMRMFYLGFGFFLLVCAGFGAFLLLGLLLPDPVSPTPIISPAPVVEPLPPVVNHDFGGAVHLDAVMEKERIQNMSSAAEEDIPAPAAPTVYDPLASLGRFTLGMTVEEAKEAAPGELMSLGSYSAKKETIMTAHSRPPFIGKRYEAPVAFGDFYAGCELAFVVDDRLSEITCALVAPAASAEEFLEHERAVMALFDVDYENVISKKAGYRNETERTWERGEHRLGISSGDGTRQEFSSTRPGANLMVSLHSLEHERVRQAVVDELAQQERDEKAAQEQRERELHRQEVERLRALSGGFEQR